MAMRFVSSIPVVRFTLSTRSCTMNSALHTMASVRAICSAMRIVPALCRRNAESMGLTCMIMSSVGFQLPGRLDLCGAPCGIEGGDQRGHDRDDEGEQHQHRIEPGQTRDAFGEHQPPAEDAYPGEDQAEHTA